MQNHWAGKYFMSSHRLVATQRKWKLVFKMAAKLTYYEILGVTRESSEKEVKYNCFFIDQRGSRDFGGAGMAQW